MSKLNKKNVEDLQVKGRKVLVRVYMSSKL